MNYDLNLDMRGQKHNFMLKSEWSKRF